MSVNLPLDTAPLKDLPLACWATDAEGRLRFLSRMAAALLGLTDADAVAGRADSPALPARPWPPLPRELLARDRVALSAGQQTRTVERLGVAAGGAARRHLVLRSPMAWGDGGQVVVLSIAVELDGATPAADGGPPEPREPHELGEATFRQVLDAISDMVLVKGPQSKLLWANQAFLDVYGMSNQQLQGMIDAPFVEPDFTQQYVRDDSHVFSTGRTLNIPEEPVTSHDGRVLTCQTVKSPIFDRQGRVSKTVGVSRDITDRKRLEAQMVSAREAAEAATHAKSDFLATVSHEIRTPLNGVLGMIEILMTTKLTDEQRTYATSVQACGRALLGLIGNVLDLSKIEAGHLQLESLPFDPIALVDECLLVVSEAATTRGLSLVFTHGPGIPRVVVGDQGRVRQVLLNLLSNAVKFTEAGSVSIDLALRSAPAQEASARAPWEGEGSAPGGGRDGIELELVVIDTGIGMSAKTIGALFHPFFQADNSTTRRYGGTGLGLAISQRIAKQMGGRIDVRSALGEGSRFSFVYRCVEASPVAPVPAARPDARVAVPERVALAPAVTTAAAVAPGAPRILLAEDNAVNRIVILKQLSLLGHAADVASTGVEALALWRRQPYDLVFMDCQMPEMDGFEATRLILLEARATGGRPAPIIVAITASAQESDGALCLAAGMTDYLSKPVGIEDLRRVLQRWA